MEGVTLYRYSPYLLLRMSTVVKVYVYILRKMLKAFVQYFGYELWLQVETIFDCFRFDLICLSVLIWCAVIRNIL